MMAFTLVEFLVRIINGPISFREKIHIKNFGADFTDLTGRVNCGFCPLAASPEHVDFHALSVLISDCSIRSATSCAPRNCASVHAASQVCIKVVSFGEWLGNFFPNEPVLFLGLLIGNFQLLRTPSLRK